MAVLCACIVMWAPRTGRADDGPPPGTPADIAAIMQKMQAGQQPTPEEQQRFLQWAHSLSQRYAANATGSQAFPKEAHLEEGIPVRIHVHLHADSKIPPYSNATCDIDATTDGMLYASIDGNGDYHAKQMGNASIHASTFRIDPLMKDRQIVRGGSGTAHRHVATSSCWEDWTGTSFRAAIGGFLLQSSGSDFLVGIGGVGGAVDGTYTAGPPDCTGDRKMNQPFTNKPSADFCIVDLPFAAEGHAQHDDPAAKPVPVMSLSYQSLVNAIAKGKSATVAGTERFDFDVGGTQFTGTSSLELTLRPKPLELVIEPSDETVYEDWLPLPNLKDGGDQELFGNPPPLSFHAALAKPGAPSTNGVTVPDADVNGVIKFVLQEISAHPGVAMNYPAYGKGDTRPDLFFLTQADQPPGIKVIDDTHAETEGAAVEATVRVGARDTGAYGQIEARIDELGLVSVNRLDGKSDLSLPLDKNQNHIADKWERDEGIEDQNLDPKWDEEDTPSGWLRTGDSISLFDQYRGFVVANGATAEKFQRISPKQKTLFYFPVGSDSALYRQGAQLYEIAAGGVKLYELHSTARLARSGDEGENLMVPRWVTFNQTPYTANKTYAVWIQDFDKPWTGVRVDGELVDKNGNPRNGNDSLGRSRRNADGSVPAGNTEGTLPEDRYFANHMSPKKTSRLNISRAILTKWYADQHWEDTFRNNEAFQDAAKAVGVDPVALGQKLDADKNPTALIDEMIVFGTMHELGHATGATHHDPDPPGTSGDEHCPMRYWQTPQDDEKDLVLFLSGQWNLTTAPDGTPWRFCPHDWEYLTFRP